MSAGARMVQERKALNMGVKNKILRQKFNSRNLLKR
jgi:hypothetical protein